MLRKLSFKQGELRRLLQSPTFVLDIAIAKIELQFVAFDSNLKPFWHICQNLPNAYMHLEDFEKSSMIIDDSSMIAY